MVPSSHIFRESMQYMLLVCGRKLEKIHVAIFPHTVLAYIQRIHAMYALSHLEEAQ